MLAEIPIGFWGFWFAVGIVLYFGLVWTLIRLAVRSDASEPRATERSAE